MTSNEKRFFGLVEEGYYSVDDEGNVWIEKPRDCIKTRDCTKKFTRQKKSLNIARGYLYLSFICQGKAYCVLHHRIVYIHHYGDIPEGMQINHIDGNRSNNCLSNLEVVTPRENVLHACNVLKTRKNYGENHTLAKLTRRDIFYICWQRWGMRLSYKEIAERSGISIPHTKRICNLHVWKHVWRDDGKVTGELNRKPGEDKMGMLPQWGFGAPSKIRKKEICDR